MSTSVFHSKYPATPKMQKGELPDPFADEHGGRVATRDAWETRARAWRDLVIDMEYGGMPPPPEVIEVESLCHSAVRRWPGAPLLNTYRIHIRGGASPFSFCVRVLFPESAEPVPAIMNGDGCWWYVSEENARKVVQSGCALVIFNRTEMAEDLGYSNPPDKSKRAGGLYDVYPGLTFGALAAWAWGYHRVVDLLHQLPFIDRARIAATGHSRGGKTSLLAGATDERITLVNDNASGAGGSATFRYVGDGGETLDILNVFPSWFGLGLRPYIGRDEDIPFDQHCLLATIAPRLLLHSYALDDRWSNPEGMVQCFQAAREVYRFLGVENNIAFHFRAGNHSHAPADWDALLDFVGHHWLGRSAASTFNRHPYTHLKPAFSWKAPQGTEHG